jgi:hypothetical protein
VESLSCRVASTARTRIIPARAELLTSARKRPADGRDFSIVRCEPAKLILMLAEGASDIAHWSCRKSSGPSGRQRRCGAPGVERSGSETASDRYSSAMRSLRYSINVTLDGCCDHCEIYRPKACLATSESSAEPNILREANFGYRLKVRYGPPRSRRD